MVYLEMVYTCYINFENGKFQVIFSPQLLEMSNYNITDACASTLCMLCISYIIHEVVNDW